MRQLAGCTPGTWHSPIQVVQVTQVPGSPVTIFFYKGTLCWVGYLIREKGTTGLPRVSSSLLQRVEPSGVRRGSSYKSQNWQRSVPPRRECRHEGGVKNRACPCVLHAGKIGPRRPPHESATEDLPGEWSKHGNRWTLPRCPSTHGIDVTR